MIAISGWLIYKAEPSYHRSMALALYAGQLVLNLIWSFFFFSLKNPSLGLIDIILLLVLIILTMIYAWSVRQLAAVLFIPYLIWVMYATTLNAGIWWLNG
jgi:tryptophan-rich sensory protein